MINGPGLLDGYRTQPRSASDEMPGADGLVRPGWQEVSENSGRHNHISQYAAMHPYEDWAETATPSRLSPVSPPQTFGEMSDQWLELTRGLNEVTRSTGRGFLYPLMLAPTVIRKLAFVDRMIRQASGRHL